MSFSPYQSWRWAISSGVQRPRRGPSGRGSPHASRFTVLSPHEAPRAGDPSVLYRKYVGKSGLNAASWQGTATTRVLRHSEERQRSQGAAGGPILATYFGTGH